jgi:hypothetical protein
MPGEASQAAGYAAATDNLRTATRWLLTAAAAAGAAMVAGVQLGVSVTTAPGSTLGRSVC